MTKFDNIDGTPVIFTSMVGSNSHYEGFVSVF